MAKSTIEKIRIPVFQMLAVIVISFIAISESAWETEYPIISVILFFIGIVLAAIASLGRLWCSLYIAGLKTKALITNRNHYITIEGMRKKLRLFASPASSQKVIDPKVED